MTCIEVPVPGEPEALQPALRPVPTPGAGEILIEVAAAGVNRPDLMQRRGQYPPPPGVSDIPGLEIAGRVAALGEGDTGWQIGDKVTALVAGGGYAEYCVAPGAQALSAPGALSMIEAAALPETFFTVWSNVFDRGRLAPGETLLVQGGSSGIGTAAIMIASNLGHPVIATAGTEEKCQACRDLGAALAINYKTQDFAEEVNKFTDGRGADVILDMVGSDYLQRELDCLAADGRISVIATLGGSSAEINVTKLMLKRHTISGSTLRTRSVEFKSAIADALRAQVWPLIEAGQIKPEIFAVLPLAQAAEAHAILEEGHHIGKVMLSTG
ncbi:MAG: NAD(P)H-quinone oxidoreductase [Rhodospirillaceae bacterium]|nr:NAD(P)H-quinone oxidoreductase [Rhodospirillaceae bacterium]MBT4751847.1 NAD(P)H-quinone oxidoreductase [Rhodospirillaceae bacterium]MBT7032126.1 NAD(P)H-quinone oxidoreductase [Rhodospirillaceae bacterium]MBT7231909.1 NAD(P)H-quinone oxidoreductase [Rhodospirillaceae bacterium]